MDCGYERDARTSGGILWEDNKKGKDSADLTFYELIRLLGQHTLQISNSSKR